MRQIRYVLFAFALWTAAPALFAQPASLLVGFPPGTVSDQLTNAAEAWNRLYGSQVMLEKIEYVDRVRDVDVTVDALLDPAVFPDRDELQDKTSIQAFRWNDLVALDAGRAALLRENLRLNLAVGDLLFRVRLREVATGASFASWNTMRPSGRGFSGTFLGAARGEPGPLVRRRLANTECDKRVLTTYLWGTPAEFVQVCVRAFCEGPRCTNCLLTEITPMAGFFAELETRPSPNQPPIPGKIVENCCFGGVAYAWATGFKKVKLAADGVSLEVEGRIGQGANGFFSVEECCKGGTERPPSEGASIPGLRPPGGSLGGTPPPSPASLPDCKMRPKLLHVELRGGPANGRATIRLTSEAFGPGDAARAEPHDLELALDGEGRGGESSDEALPILCLENGCLDDFTFTVKVGYVIFDADGVPRHSGYETLRLPAYSCGSTKSVDGTIDFQDGATGGTIYVLTEVASECVADCGTD